MQIYEIYMYVNIYVYMKMWKVGNRQHHIYICLSLRYSLCDFVYYFTTIFSCFYSFYFSLIHTNDSVFAFPTHIDFWQLVIPAPFNTDRLKIDQWGKILPTNTSFKWQDLVHNSVNRSLLNKFSDMDAVPVKEEV